MPSSVLSGLFGTMDSMFFTEEAKLKRLGKILKVFLDISSNCVGSELNLEDSSPNVLIEGFENCQAPCETFKKVHLLET